MRKTGLITASIEVDVPFHDIDINAIVWHGHYFKYLENARWALMDRIGFGLEAMMASGYVWPIVDTRVRYIRASRFGDRLAVQASLIEWQNRLLINYLLTDTRDQSRIARAQTAQVAVTREGNVMQLVSPPCLLERVQQHIADEH